ncbi:MAG: flagellar cap protein FliD N-terminal domain-containing protein, partial [Acetivibrio ethanolgignens]
MASVTGTTSSSILSALSNKRFSGLASGLDTDELVKNMTSSTRSKIAKIEQQKQKAQWKMDGYRSISSKLINFQNKFTSYTSSTNLRSVAFYNKSVITSVGENSKYVKASGSGDNIGNATIAGVKQLATKTSYVSTAPVSGSTLTGAEIDVTQEVKTSKLAGQSFSFTYNNSTYKVKLDDSKDYASMGDVVAEINLQLQKTDYARDNKKLSEYITASNENGKLKIDFASEEVRNIGNTIEITKVDSKI